MVNWSELPEDVIGLFADRLPRLRDFVKFGCVCRSWRSASIEAKTRRKASDLWLVMAKRENDKISGEDGGEVRSCYSISSDNVFNLSLPELRGRRCWGTQYGWIITLGVDSEYQLFNPLTKARFSLPPRSTFPDQSDQGDYDDDVHMCRAFPGNFALSSNPSDSGESVVVMAMYDGCRHLAFASPSDKSWTCLRDNFRASGDVVFFKDRFYYVGLEGTLGMCDINTTEPVCVDIAPPPSPSHKWVFNPYLAEISGNLHIIFRRYHGVNREVYENYHMESVHFYIYKFDFHTQQWIEVKDIGIHSLFLGNNTTFAISTSEYPELKLTANCIYFTDDHTDYYVNEFCDLGVYDIRMEAIIDPFYKPEGGPDILLAIFHYVSTHEEDLIFFSQFSITFQLMRFMVSKRPKKGRGRQVIQLGVPIADASQEDGNSAGSCEDGKMEAIPSLLQDVIDRLMSLQVLLLNLIVALLTFLMR